METQRTSPTPSGAPDTPWQVIFDGLCCAAMVVSTGGQVTHINAAARRFLRVPRGQRVPHLQDMAFLREGGAAGKEFARLIRQAQQGRTSADRCLPLTHDARAFAPQSMEMCVTVSPMGGQVEGPLDVLAQWQIRPTAVGEAAYRPRLRQLEAIVEHSAAVIFVKDLSHRYILANQAFLNIFDLATAVGLDDYQLFGKQTAEVLRANDRMVLASKSHYRCEEQVPTHTEVRTFLALKFPLFDWQGQVIAICGIATDITDTKRAQERNKQLMVHAQAAEEASQLKSDFLATMSHEIRTPLSGIIGICGLLSDGAQTEIQKQMTAQMHQAATCLLEILNDILDLSKLEAGKFDFDARPVQLAFVIETVTDTLAPVAAKKGLRLLTSIDERLPACLVIDAKRLRQVLFNLISNAVKFSQAGDICLSFSWRPKAKGVEGEFYLYIVVEDQGIGIAQENLEKLFQVFTQADASISRRFGGTGLGLAICRSIVEAQGGRIGADSQVNKGSRFWCQLPTREGVALPEAQMALTPTQLSLTGKILVAEDNAINQLVVMALLGKLGLSCDLAEDGIQAVSRASKSSYDAIIMDCHMPGMDGLEATRRIRKMTHHRQMPIIALTANAMRGEKERCLAAGMSRHLIKPIDAEGLFSMLSHVMNKTGAKRAGQQKA